MSLHLHDLIMDYRNLLGFVYSSDNWEKYQKGKTQPHANYRHIIRTLIFNQRRPTYDLLAKAEGAVLSKRPANHATIIHSLEVFDESVKKKYFVLVTQLEEYYQQIIASQEKLNKMGSGVFRIDKVDGIIQIHLHFPNEHPSRNFLQGLEKLINKEHEVQHG